MLDKASIKEQYSAMFASHFFSMAKKTAQLNIRIEEDDIAVLAEIEKNHYINPSLLTRGLVKAAVSFYREHGWFSFPVLVQPKTEDIVSGEKIDVWKFKPTEVYHIKDDAVVADIMDQLGVSNLVFPKMAEVEDVVSSVVAFDNHPTHWLMFYCWQGMIPESHNGIFFNALPKWSKSRKQMLEDLQSYAREIGSNTKPAFSHLPEAIGKKRNQTATKAPSSS